MVGCLAVVLSNSLLKFSRAGAAGGRLVAETGVDLLPMPLSHLLSGQSTVFMA